MTKVLRGCILGNLRLLYGARSILAIMHNDGVNKSIFAIGLVDLLLHISGIFVNFARQNCLFASSARVGESLPLLRARSSAKKRQL